MMYRSGYLVLLFLLLGSLSLTAQRTLSLQQCVNIAYDQSLELQNMSLNMEQADINVRQARHARYPSLNASTSYSQNFGRTIDPTSNSFINQTSGFQTLSLNAGLSLFEGGAINKQIQRSEKAAISSLERKNAARDNIGLQVAQNYLNALLAEEAMELARVQMDLTESQLQRIDRLINAGSVPANDRLDIEAQLMRDQQELINAVNNYEIALLTLKNLLLIEVNEDIQLEKIDAEIIPIDTSTLALPFYNVYQQALDYQPSIKADAMDLEVAELDEEINRARLWPTLRLGASLTSNYSELARQITSIDSSFVESTVQINGMDVIIGLPNIETNFGDIPYLDQLDNNLGYGAGVTLSLPIYNNYSARLNVQRAEVSRKQVEIQNEINRQNLKATIQNAIAQARAAQQSYKAGQKAAVAQRATMDNIQKRVDAGAANNYEFIQAKNNLTISENRLLQSKYDYIFKLKVIDYYLGKPLKL